MNQSNFAPQRIDHHVELVKVRIQAPIDIKADRIHLQEFFNRVSERQSHLYDSLAQEPNAFEIKKQLLVRGVGRLEVTTFSLAPLGPVLMIPRKLPMAHDEFRWSDNLNEEIGRTLATLLECHPGRTVAQLTKRREVIFATASNDSSEFLRAQFAAGVPADGQDVGVRWARSDEQYDRRVTLDAVRRKNVVRQVVDGVLVQREEATPEFGIRLVVEVTNRRSPKPFAKGEWAIVLDHADSYYNEVLTALKGTESEHAA